MFGVEWPLFDSRTVCVSPSLLASAGESWRMKICGGDWPSTFMTRSVSRMQAFNCTFVNGSLMSGDATTVEKSGVSIGDRGLSANKARSEEHTSELQSHSF